VSKLYIIRGNPIALARPRFSRQTGACYDSQKMEKLQARIYLEKQMGSLEKLTGPLALYVTFYMPIPKNTSAKRRIAMDGTPHCVRADLDNLLKFVCDLSNDLLIGDDASICMISSRKIYSQAPKTLFAFIPYEAQGEENGTAQGR